MNMFDTFYQLFLFFVDYVILVGFKIGKQVFDDPGVGLSVGGGTPYG